MSGRLRRGLAIVAVCLVVTTMVPPGVAGAPESDTSTSTGTDTTLSTDGADVAGGVVVDPHDAREATSLSSPREVPANVEIDIERVNGSYEIRYTYTFDLPDDTTQFEVRYDEAYSAAEATGFDKDHQLRWNNRSWDGETTPPSITLEKRAPVNSTDRLTSVAGPGVDGDIQRGDPPESGHVDRVYEQFVGAQVAASREVDGDGILAPTLYVGAHTTYTETVDGQEITLVVSRDADLAASVEDVLAAVSATERTIEGGPREDTYVVVRRYFPTRGIGGGREATIRSDASLEVYIHEFTHINQETQFAEEMAWFTEGSAQYYGEYFEEADGRLGIKPAVVLRKTGPTTNWPEDNPRPNATLANSDTWGPQAHYYKGARLLFALDAKLRENTDGEVTTHDLMRRVNQHDEYVIRNYAEFREIVVDLGGEETASWLDPYVLTSQTPPQPNTSAFGVTPNFVDEPTDISGDSRETYRLGIAVPSEQGIDSAALALEAGEASVQAVVSDGNDDGRVDVRFQPYDNGRAVLEPVDSADELRVERGTLQEPFVSDPIRVDLLLTNRSGETTRVELNRGGRTATYRASSMSIGLESTPTRTPFPTEEPGLSSKIPFLNTDQLLRVLAILGGSIALFALLVRR